MATLTRPREAVVRRLFAVSMNQCAMPDCTTQLVSSETGTILGEVCHIRAHNPGGPRYLDSQTDEERHGFGNLVLLCRNCHKLIDAFENLEIYSVDSLVEIKRRHEEAGVAAGAIDASSQVITALQWTVAVYEAGATHMDFRNAVFKVGGEGGHPLGGGGEGGVLTIVGIGSLPNDIAAEMTIDLAGGPGSYPGGGGGGGGVLKFEGRTVETDDIAAGLKIPVFFPANSVAVADGLVHLLGGGWEYYRVPELPFATIIDAALVVEFGTTQPNSMLSFDVSVLDPGEHRRHLSRIDVEVPEPTGSLNRVCRSVRASIEFEVPGVHELVVTSGEIRLCVYSFEVRIQ
ncbi:HNH endonuclease signature motif containing protein [Gordonia amicalis]|uniref:HNH endonuclease signature motif containing protein n=2 Tax=Gordonia amicalis TaxID=89053 RepID=UPI002954A994|nr:HNH endonuclease signature motif containing protein [Gordonia amicalis]MDV7101213.1 HNH endonuclease signature motif containing protein [Gordonia amicalis]